MREIKFRVWDKANKEFLPQECYAVTSEGPSLFIMIHSFKCLNVREYGYSHSFELMQYTGLKDKNGKEIYEGDIITCVAIQREVHDIIDKDKKVIVEYDDGYFYPFGYNCGWRSEVMNVEVIGNIHENPELLKTNN